MSEKPTNNNDWMPCDDNIFAAFTDKDFDSEEEMQPKDYYNVLKKIP